MRDRRQTMKDSLPMRNAFFRAMAVSALAMLSLLPGVLVVQPVRAQAPKVVIDCLPPWETNNRFLEPTKIKHPGLSLNGFDCDDNCDIGYGLKQVLEKVYGDEMKTDSEVKGFFVKIVNMATKPLKVKEINNNSAILQSRGFVALASYVLENNDYDPTILSPVLPSAKVAINHFRTALLQDSMWQINKDIESDGVKWTESVTNVARAIDFYLALENAYKHYDINEFRDKKSNSLLSLSQKEKLMKEYKILIFGLNRRASKFFGLFSRFHAEPGNAPLKIQVAAGYASLAWQEHEYKDDIENTSIPADTINNYIPRAFRAAGHPTEKSRYKYWNYQSDNGKLFWAEGAYYLHITLSDIIPFWHAVRINNLLTNTSLHSYNFADPFRQSWLLNPLHWMADISTPDGKTPPIDDGNKEAMYNAGLLRWNNEYGDYKIGEKFARIVGSLKSFGGLSLQQYLYPIAIAIPFRKITDSTLPDGIIGNKFDDRKDGENGRQEVVVRRTINGMQHYIFLNGESGDAIIRGEGHEQGDQLQLLYYIDDTSYLLDSGYDKGGVVYNSSWNRYNDHNVMILDPDDSKYSSADGGVRSPIVINLKGRKTSEHQSVNEIYVQTHENIDLLSARVALNASPKTLLKPIPTIYYKDFASYYRNVLFIRDPNHPYLVDINAVSSHHYNKKNKYHMLYYGNSEDTNILLNTGQKFDALRWSNIYDSSVIKESDGTVVLKPNASLQSPKTNKKLYIRPFVVERSQKYPHISEHKAREVYVSIPNGKGYGVPVKRLRISSNSPVSTDSKENFTTVAFISALPQGGMLGIRGAVAQRPDSNTGDLEWQYFTRLNRDTTIVDIVVVRSAEEFANTSSANILHFPVQQADSLYVELGNHSNYGFLRLVKDNNIWSVDPSFQLNLEKSLPGVRVSGPSCIKENHTGHFASWVFGGKPPYSYNWSSYRICPDSNYDSIESSSVYPCNEWTDIGNKKTIDFGRYGGKFGFKIRVKVTDSSSPQESAISDALQVRISFSNEDSCPDNIADDVLGKQDTNNLQSLLSNEGLSETYKSIPEAYALRQSFPNPFNPSTEIRFDLPETVTVSLVVYDVLGREVARLVEDELQAGWHRARFDAGSLPSGVYLYRIQAGDFMDTGRMILLK